MYYIEKQLEKPITQLFEYITGDIFVKEDVSNVIKRVEQNVLNYLAV